MEHPSRGKLYKQNNNEGRAIAIRLTRGLFLSAVSRLRIGLLSDNPYTLYGALARSPEISSSLVTDGAQ